MKLARLFTGAEVLMRIGAKQVMGTLQPGPRAASPTAARSATAGATTRPTRSPATAFPSGPLRISLLF